MIPSDYSEEYNYTLKKKKKKLNSYFMSQVATQKILISSI